MSKTPRIAVVNDDTAFLTLMAELLTDEGYDIHIHRVSNTASSFIEELLPDLLILDIRMDNAESGWQVLELVRLNPATVDIPVIVCSADSVQLREKSNRLRQHNAVPLEKPFDLPELLEHVRNAVGPPVQT